MAEEEASIEESTGMMLSTVMPISPALEIIISVKEASESMLSAFKLLGDADILESMETHPVTEASLGSSNCTSCKADRARLAVASTVTSWSTLLTEQSDPNQPALQTQSAEQSGS
jgi:hypothetical protein